MKYFYLIFISLLLALGGQNMAQAQTTAEDFSFSSLTDGEDIDLSKYSGKVLLVVNTASQCGFAPQFRELQSLYTQNEDRGLVVIGVPSNDFGGQEPGNNSDIQKFCELNYGITFPMTSKQVVRGPNAHPFYRWAHQVLGEANIPRWNFHKYLVGRDGRLIDSFSSNIRPNDERLLRAVEKALNQNSE